MIVQVSMSLSIRRGKNHPSLASLCGNIALNLAAGLYYSVLWILPSVLTAIMLKYFEEKCKNYYEEFIQNCKNCLELYDKLSAAFKNYLFLMFILVQSWAIFYTFISLSSLVKKKTNSLTDILETVAALTQIGGNIFCLITVTGCLDEAYQCLQDMKRQAQDNILASIEKKERQQLKYIIQRIESTRPMTARGYFEIDKTTLTSMLSVR